MPRPSLDSLKTQRNFEGRIHPLIHINCLTDGQAEAISVLCRLDTQIEVAYYQSGGILNDVLRRLIGEGDVDVRGRRSCL